MQKKLNKKDLNFKDHFHLQVNYTILIIPEATDCHHFYQQPNNTFRHLVSS